MTGGIDLLIGWVLFLGLLAVLTGVLLHRSADPLHEMNRHVDDPPAETSPPATASPSAGRSGRAGRRGPG